MSHCVRRRVLMLAFLSGIGGGLVPRAARAQNAATARQAFDGGMRTALAGQADSSLQFFQRAAEAARASGDRSLQMSALRGQADVWLTLRGCSDSALRILRDATASSEGGDRSVADALVRLLVARGDLAGARETLVAAYADAAGGKRAVTHENLAFLRGNAAIERGEGHESAAFSALNEAIAIADQLHQADARDPRAHAMGEVTRENAWLIYDLAQLRANAKSPSIRSARESARLMTMLLGAWSIVDDLPGTVPTVRLGDRLILRAERCKADGTSCPVPASSPSC